MKARGRTRSTTYDGGKRLEDWFEAGATVVALDSSVGYLIELLELPVVDVLDEVDTDRFNCPGSMLGLLVDTENPLGYGLRPEEGGYFASSSAFRTRLPDARPGRRLDLGP